MEGSVASARTVPPFPVFPWRPAVRFLRLPPPHLCPTAGVFSSRPPGTARSEDGCSHARDSHRETGSSSADRRRELARKESRSRQPGSRRLTRRDGLRTPLSEERASNGGPGGEAWGGLAAEGG